MNLGSLKDKARKLLGGKGKGENSSAEDAHEVMDNEGGPTLDTPPANERHGTDERASGPDAT